jgi:hypothetical protein
MLSGLLEPAVDVVNHSQGRGGVRYKFEHRSDRCVHPLSSAFTVGSLMLDRFDHPDGASVCELRG